MDPYRHADWRHFREQVIKLDGGRCVRCLRGRADDVVLQVHHKHYVKGRLPWQYEHSDCETLCKGCHAKEHGIIEPTSGWDLVGCDDLGDLIGECDYCGQTLRYLYLVTHPNWPAMEIGTDCCDKLTGTEEASTAHIEYLRVNEMRRRFVTSKRWSNLVAGEWTIRQKSIDVSIFERFQRFTIAMDGYKGKAECNSLFDAKVHVFDAIHSGKAATWLKAKEKDQIGNFIRWKKRW